KHRSSQAVCGCAGTVLRYTTLGEEAAFPPSGPPPRNSHVRADQLAFAPALSFADHHCGTERLLPRPAALAEGAQGRVRRLSRRPARFLQQGLSRSAPRVCPPQPSPP